METIKQSKVFLRWPKRGRPGPFGHPVHADDAEMFVALDSASGGYPATTTIDRAHDFKTVAEEVRYRGHFDKLDVYEVEVVYNLRPCDV